MSGTVAMPPLWLALSQKDGKYCSPDTDPGINGETLATFVQGVWAAFPDFTVELLNVGEIEAGLVALHWRVRGTNTGPGGDGSEPTGRSVSFQGASIIRLEGEKIRSDYAYFDRKTIEEQLAPK
jgi:predicted ester cyclase